MDAFNSKCIEEQGKCEIFMRLLTVCENLVTFSSLLLSDHILCSVTWPTDERVVVQWLTRKQNYVIVQIYDFDGSSWKEKQVAFASLVMEIMTSSPVRSPHRL